MMVDFVWGDPTAMFEVSQGLIAKAETFTNALTAQAGQFAAPTVNVSFPSVAIAPTPAVGTLPALQRVVWDTPAQPAEFTDRLNVDDLLLPFTGVAPTIRIGDAPTPFTTDAPPSPPIDLNFEYPVVAVTLPTAPQLFSIDTVSFPSVVVPGFSAQAPSLTLAAPAPFVYVEGALFTSALLTALRADLLDAVENGTNLCLPTPAQQALTDAAYEREYRTQANAIAELARMETLGYAFPPGVFLDARLKIQTETANTMAGLSRDIFAKQSELQLENLVKARDQAASIEGKLIEYVNQVAQRTFEAAKYAVQSAVDVYNARVKQYETSLDMYRTQAQIYDTQIKGIMARVDVTKAQIDYEKTKSDINTALVTQYRSEVEASEAVLQIYKTQVDIIQSRASVEKLKVDVFGAQIQAFTGQINAYGAKVEAYKASIQAQQAVQEAYKVSVDAYGVEVTANVAQINAQVEAYKGRIVAYTSRLQSYDSAVKGMLGQAQAASEYNTAQADVFKAQVAAVTSYNSTLTSQWQAVIDQQEKIAQIAVAAQKANGDLYISARGLSLDASKVGATVSSQLGAAALGAISWHSGYSSSRSSSLSTSTANSFSTSNSYSNSTSNSNSNSNSNSTSNINEQIASV
jgi:hypothetical protein